MAMSTTRKIVLVISSIVLALVLIVVVGIAIIATAFGGKRPSIEDNSVLTLKVSGSLPDYVPDDPLRRLLRGQPQSLSSLLAQFRKAKVDKRITAVLLDIDISEVGWAKSEEIRDAITDFRSSGKPVYAYMETGLNKDYYIATACDKIFVPPPGELFTIGLAADVMFFRGSLDKLGIYPDLYQIGKYKSAGDITSGRSTYGGSGQDTIGSDSLVKTINDARDDKTIKAIVLRIDSPGGSGLASDIIWRAVESAKEKKPIVVSMSDVAASGGYYIACNANKIVAEPSTITGSIGVVGGKPVIKGFYDWIGVTNEYVLRGQNSGMFRESEKFSDSERKKWLEFLGSTYDDFTSKVAKGRKREQTYIDSIGQGRVWTGQQGKERGLVDEYGGLDKAIEVAKQLANIPADKSIQRMILPHPPGFFEQLMNGGGEDDADAKVKTKEQEAILATLPEGLRHAFRYAQMLDRAKNGEVMLLLPFDLRIK